jgi:hypothetical protein
MKKVTSLSIASLALGAVMFAVPAFATSNDDCGSTDQSSWMSIEAITAKGVALGYEVSNVKTEDGCYELYAKKDGQRFEVYMHPVSGEVVRVKNDD